MWGCIGQLELIVDPLSRLRGSYTAAQVFHKNTEPSLGFLRTLTKANSSWNLATSSKGTRLMGLYLIHFIINILAPLNSFIGFHFRCFFDIDPEKNPILPYSADNIVPVDEGDFATFGELWTRLADRSASIDAPDPEACPISAWFYTHLRSGHHELLDTFKQLTATSRSPRTRVKTYDAIAVGLVKLRPVVLHCLQNNDFRSLIHSLLNIPVMYPDLVSRPAIWSLPLLVGNDVIRASEVDTAPVPLSPVVRLPSLPDQPLKKGATKSKEKGPATGWQPMVTLSASLNAALRNKGLFFPPASRGQAAGIIRTAISVCRHACIGRNLAVDTKRTI